MEKKIRVQVIIGSTRQGRFGERPANYIYNELKKEDGVDAELVDLRDWPLPFFDEAMPPRMRSMQKAEPQNEMAKKWMSKVAEADAYIMVTPEYNHGYPAVLKNALDWLYTEWAGRPVGFVSYGSVGGARAVEQLRQVVIELQMHPISNSIHIPGEIFGAVMMGKAPADNAELFKPLREGRRGDSVKPFFDELITLAKKLR